MNYFIKAWWMIKTYVSFGIFRNIGWLTYVANPIFLSGKSRMIFGDRVRIFPGARIEVMKGAILRIDSGVSIGPNVNITVAKNVQIRKGTTLSANVFITDMDHDISIKNTSVMETNNILSSGTSIGSYCFVGAGVVILAGTQVENNVVIGANSVVRGRLNNASIYAGSPARFLRPRFDK